MDNKDIVFYDHSIEEVNSYYKAIVSVAQDFINEVNNILKRKVTVDYELFVSVEGDKLVFRGNK
ncbi:hypothetical protein [Butyrivibrio sp. VCB2001]|uniref:hypothetical protein n=1 Tax=Butyrivibrio sp. VCB2001 TaxID=1280667 RepID=UPI0012DF0B09|nr:hypothetical protein [Butyrivibrio sp. VCB2001]